MQVLFVVKSEHAETGIDASNRKALAPLWHGLVKVRPDRRRATAQTAVRRVGGLVVSESEGEAMHVNRSAPLARLAVAPSDKATGALRAGVGAA
jgi:hypothetical protein